MKNLVYVAGLLTILCFGCEPASPNKGNRTTTLTTTPSSSPTTSTTEKKSKAKSENSGKVDLTDLEIPAPLKNEEIIKHTGYTVSYNEEHEQANWVAYELTKEEVAGKEERKDRFVVDPEVTTGTATIADYKGSGYDRGHLAPAADMRWSETVMKESFYFSNMSPQAPGFNRGIWKALEERVRDWANEDSKIYVVTGGVLKKGLKTIGKSKVSIPEQYYKVILDYNEPEVKAIAFLMPNEKTKQPISDYVVSIDEVEKVTGIDFFPKLRDRIEEDLENHFDMKLWDLK